MRQVEGYNTLPRRPGVGRIYHKENGKSFVVFSSVDIKERIRNTLCFLERKELHSAIQREWDPKQFACEVLEITEERSRYYYWIKQYDTFGNGGYNVNFVKYDIPNIPGVYIIRNTKNGRVYVGWASKSMRQRIKSHVSNLNRGIEGNISLQQDWELYNDRFEFGVLEETKDPSREAYWILKLRAISTGYNVKLGNRSYCYSDIIKMEDELNESISYTD